MRLEWKIALAAGVLAAQPVSAIAQIAPPASVETTQLPTDAFAIGNLEAGEPALPLTMWNGSNPQTLEYLLDHAPTRPASPSLGKAMHRTLLSPSASMPVGAGASLGGKKLLALVRAGFVEDAQTVSSLATTGKNDLYVAEADATISLLSGNPDGACRRGASLNGGREAIFWVRLRAFCYARAGELDAFDLTMNLLRERGAVTPAEEALLLSVATKAPPKTVPAVTTPLQYAALQASGIDVSAGSVSQAEGGVLFAIFRNESISEAVRIEALEQAIALGVADASELARFFTGLQFEIAELGSVLDLAAARPNDPVVDAMLFQSISEMNAPEFIRDKAQRISIALTRANSFAQAYSLSHLYAAEVATLEGVLVSPQEAESFALAAMATGDGVGAGRWLSAMIGANESVAALPEPLGIAFIERVNLLALLDPQTAAQIARRAGVSVLADDAGVAPGQFGYEDEAVTARILESAFDAVAGGKVGQAALASLAASAGTRPDKGGAVESVIISKGLQTAEMPELSRRHRFEQAWAATFSQRAPVLPDTNPEEGGAAATSAPAQQGEESGITPRLKPTRSQ